MCVCRPLLTLLVCVVSVIRLYSCHHVCLFVSEFFIWWWSFFVFGGLRIYWCDLSVFFFFFLFSFLEPYNLLQAVGQSVALLLAFWLVRSSSVCVVVPCLSFVPLFLLFFVLGFPSFSFSWQLPTSRPTLCMSVARNGCDPWHATMLSFTPLRFHYSCLANKYMTHNTTNHKEVYSVLFTKHHPISSLLRRNHGPNGETKLFLFASGLCAFCFAFSFTPYTTPSPLLCLWSIR